jgi:peroxiredoxin
MFKQPNEQSQEQPDAPPSQGHRFPVRVALGAGALVLAGLVVVIAFGGEDGRVALDATGEPAPSVDLVYRDGTSVPLAQLAAQPAVLNFFADWCPACVAEMPGFEAVHDEFAGDVTFIGLDQSTSDAGLDALIAATGITYGVALDRDGQIFAAFQGLGMPTTVFLHADGTVARVHSGAIFEDDLRATLNELFFTGS